MEEIVSIQYLKSKMEMIKKSLVPALHTYNVSSYPTIYLLYEELDPQIKELYNKIFSEIDPPNQISLGQIVPLSKKVTDMPVCNREFGRSTTVYQCYDCQLNEACIICRQCFQESDHRGHRYGTINIGGGNCDCGNSQSIKKEGFCKNHSGQLKLPEIKEQQQKQFNKYIRQIWIWFLKLYQGQNEKSLILLIHLVRLLQKLNDQSLYYNVLTYNLLFQGQNKLIDHLFVIGSKHLQTNLSKNITDLFFKMFSLPECKNKLAQLYIVYYNKVAHFQTTGFQSLFSQLFSNWQITQKTISKLKMTLDPRQRDYKVQSYLQSLYFIDNIRPETVRMFFGPLLETGVDFCVMRTIQKQVENGDGSIAQFYQKILFPESLYYWVNAILAKHFQGQPSSLALLIRSQMDLVNRYSYNKNKVIIPHHRCLAMYIFVYYKCDLEAINPQELREILNLSVKQFLGVIDKIVRCFLHCYGQFSNSLSYTREGRYEFNAYLALYAQNSYQCQLFNWDALGLRVFSMILAKMGEKTRFGQLLWTLYRQQIIENQRQSCKIKREIQQLEIKLRLRQDLNTNSKIISSVSEIQDQIQVSSSFFFGRSRGLSQGLASQRQSPQQIIQLKQKILNNLTALFFKKWVHLLIFLLETICLQQSEIKVANTCKIVNSTVRQMNFRQLVQIFTNVRQISVNDMEKVIELWFGEIINKEDMIQAATFDKKNKKYVIKEEVVGIPLFKELLQSMMRYDSYIKDAKQGIELNQKNIHIMEVLFSTQMWDKFYNAFLGYYKENITTGHDELLQKFATLVKIVINVKGKNSVDQRQKVNQLISLAQKHSLKQQVMNIIQIKSESQNLEESTKQQKRIQDLKRRQKQKLKSRQQGMNESIKKMLNQQNLKSIAKEQQNQVEQCIICRGGKDLFYLGFYGQSNVIFSALGIEGTYPYFKCCFHSIHLTCYLDLCNNSDKVECPLCRAVSNIILPTVSVLKDQQMMRFVNQRLQIMNSLVNNSQDKDLTSYLMKGLLGLFLLNLVEDKPLNQKRINLYKIVFETLKVRYNLLEKIQKQQFESNIMCNRLTDKNKKYQTYSFEVIEDWLNNVTIKILNKEEVYNDDFSISFIKSGWIPREDVEKCFNLASLVFDLHLNMPNQIKEFNDVKPLSSLFKFYVPPKNIKNLLKERAGEEGKCKFGHHSVVCIICDWRGCGDCEGVLLHTNQIHCRSSIYFNFITGGILYVTNNNRVKKESIYLDEISGRSWNLISKDDYLLDKEYYKQLIQSIKSESIREFVISKLNKRN